jgi:ubiquitin-protein ligase
LLLFALAVGVATTNENLKKKKRERVSFNDSPIVDCYLFFFHTFYFLILNLFLNCPTVSSSDEEQRHDNDGEAAGEDVFDPDRPPNLYTADVVERRTGSSRRRELGVLMHAGWISDDEFDDADDIDFEDDEVVVNWSENGIAVCDPLTIRAVDRVLMFGDNVERADAPRGAGPYATVIGLRVTATIESLEQRANATPLFRRRGVDVLAELTKPFRIDTRSIVVYRCFMGVVRTVMFDMDVSAGGLTVTLNNVSTDALDMYLEGDEASGLRLSCCSDIEVGNNLVLDAEIALTFISDAQAQSLRGLMPREFVTVRVDAIRQRDAVVHWIGAPAGRYGHTADSSAELPRELMPLDDLTVLDPVVDTGSFMFNCTARVASTGRMCNIVDTRATVDLRWQDGTIERDLRAIDFVPIAHLLDQDMFPGDFVVSEAVSDAANNLSHSSSLDDGAGATATSANVNDLDRTLDQLLVAPGAAATSAAGDDGASLSDPLAARNSLLRRRGVVVSVSHQAQTCSVMWLREPSGVAVDGRPADSVLENNVSMLALKPHPEMDDLRLSDIVTLMPGHPSLANTPPPPFVGCLIDVNLTNGFLRVKWSDGSVSEVDSHDVHRIDPGTILALEGDEEDDEDGDDDDTDGDEEWAGEFDGDAGARHIAEPVLAMLMGDQNADAAMSANVRREINSVVRDLSRGPDMALLAVARLYCGASRFTPLFAAPGTPLVPFPATLEQFLANFRGQQLPAVTLLGLSLTGNADPAPFYEACRAHVTSVLAGLQGQSADGESPAAAPAAPLATPAAPAPAAAAPEVASEHFFVSSGVPPAVLVTLTSFDLQSSTDNGEGAALGPPTAAHGSSHQFAHKEVQFRASQRAMEEWQVLQGGLPPNGIGVRVYEERLDVLKLLVFGPAGSPYEDVPFFFDVRFPAEYPQVAPEVHFLSFVGQKLHPNLNVDGNVCLSLLGTWSGAESESWQGPLSTVLQLALSLQGLVLGDAEPYFLEAGYERQRGTAEGQRHSKRYTERALLLVIRHLIHVAARCAQDVHFERLLAARGVVADADDSGDGGVFGFRQMLRAHFLSRGDALVARFTAYTGESSAYSSGCRVALAPIVARLERVIRTLKELLA